MALRHRTSWESFHRAIKAQFELLILHSNFWIPAFYNSIQGK